MLKLPKGLKKKKKKSKKDQELFTEEELEQYKREHQAHPEQSAAAATSDDNHHRQEHPEQSSNDDEWSRFAALTTGIDSVLKKTQGDLDRIKESSFFKRVAPPVKVEEPEPVKEEVVVEEPKEVTKAEQLLNAVVELSDSEDESVYDDSAFDTTFTEQELPLAYVPESPEDEADLGPDPFDTGYAEKVIKGPEVSSKGKKIVNIGAAVSVLTGKVETAATTTKTRRQRRGIQNLMLESFEANAEDGEVPPAPEPLVTKTLLDEPAELEEEVQIDLSTSLHLSLLKSQKKDDESSEQKEDDIDDVLSKVEITFTKPKDSDNLPSETQDGADWSEFEIEADKSEFCLSFQRKFLFLFPF